MKEKEFFIFLISALIVVIFFSMSLPMIFRVEVPEIESFNFSMHKQLEFDDAFRGTNPNATTTFAYFFSFKCPVCVKHYPEISRLMSEHNEVNFLFKHLISLDDEEEVFSAKAFECAKLQDKGYDLADYFFTNPLFTKKSIISYLENISTDMTKFYECIEMNETSRIIEGDIYHASFLNVRGSPTIFLNGIKIEGLHSFEVYDELIKKEQNELFKTN